VDDLMLVAVAPDRHFVNIDAAILHWKTARMQLAHKWPVRYMALSPTGGVLYSRTQRVKM
jgi:hypothetical protein